MTAYQGKQKLWQKEVSKAGLSSGVEAADGHVIVGNAKGQLFALDQATGEQKWTAQLTGAHSCAIVDSSWSCDFCQ